MKEREYTLILRGEPKSTQHIYRATCRGRFPTTYMTREGKAIKEAYQWEAKSQWKGKPLTGSVKLSLTFFFKTKRCRDLDNQNKLVLDALSGIAYEDDSQIDVLCLFREYDASNPRIEVSIQEL